MLHKLIRQFEQENGLQLPEVEALAASVQVHQLADREPAFHMGAACARVFGVRSGVLKQLYVSRGGIERIKSFASEGELFACPFALRADGRTSFASVAIGPAVVESVPWSQLESLAERHPAWQAVLRIGFQRLAEAKVRRERDLLMLSTTALYEQFVRAHPALAARVPQKDLAAYFGVTPVGLNRIVRRLALTQKTE